MNWTKENALATRELLKRHEDLGEALAMLSTLHRQPVTEGMLKGAFMRFGLGGVREHLRAAAPAAAPKIARTALGKLYFVTTDEHVPYQDENCQEAINALADDLKPDGWIIGGDGLDMLELSRHSAQSVAKLEGRRIAETWRQGNRWLENKFTAAGPQCTDRRYIPGNHEDRINRWIASGDHGVFAEDDGLSIEHRLGFPGRGIKMEPNGYPEAGYMLGKLWITHGRFTNKYHAAKHLDFYRHSVMYGHTHSPQVMFGSALRGQQAAFGLGHLGDPESEAMGYAPRPNAWAQGFALVHVYPDGSFNAQPIQFWRGQFTYAGRTYGRRSRVR